MLSIKLINMPFATLSAPSIALTQLRSVIAAAFPGQVLVEIAYLNARDAAEWLGRLNELISRWHSHWEHPSGPPRLELATSTSIKHVVDTRAGAQRRHVMSDSETALLETARSPLLEDRVASEHRSALNSIIRKGLVFRERSRLMSIVGV